MAENEDDGNPPKFSFIDRSRVRPVKTANLVSLEQCPKIEDFLQYHGELLMKGRIQVHDAIRVANCKDAADLISQCKLAFRDTFSLELVLKYADVAGTINIYNEPY